MVLYKKSRLDNMLVIYISLFILVLYFFLCTLFFFLSFTGSPTDKLAANEQGFLLIVIGSTLFPFLALLILLIPLLGKRVNLKNAGKTLSSLSDLKDEWFVISDGPKENKIFSKEELKKKLNEATSSPNSFDYNTRKNICAYDPQNPEHQAAIQARQQELIEIEVNIQKHIEEIETGKNKREFDKKQEESLKWYQKRIRENTSLKTALAGL